MREIRIVVGKTPRLLGEIIIAALAKENLVHIVGEAENDVDLVDVCTRVKPDAVVMGVSDSESDAIGHRLLRQCPFARLFALALDKRVTYLFELKPQKTMIGELSARDLAQTVVRTLRPASKNRS